MVDETHKLQKDPPEGSRKVVEHELKRQSRETGRDAGAARSGRPENVAPDGSDKRPPRNSR